MELQREQGADNHSWCQPCRVLTPLLKEVTEPGSGYDLMTINVDDHPDLAGQFKVCIGWIRPHSSEQNSRSGLCQSS